MQMVIGIVVLVLIAVGVWWYMGNGTLPTDDAAMQDDAAMMTDDAAMEDDAMAQ